MSENNIDTVNNNNNNTTKTKLSEEELLKKIEETQRSAEEIVKRFVQNTILFRDVKIENLNLNWAHHLVLCFGYLVQVKY